MSEQSFNIAPRAIPNPGYIWVSPYNLTYYDTPLWDEFWYKYWAKHVKASIEEAALEAFSMDADTILCLVINNKIAWQLGPKENKTVIE